MRILFLDDAPWRHKFVRSQMEDVLSKVAGIEVVHVWTVDEFVDAISTKGPFDRISLDFDLNDCEHRHGKSSKVATAYGWNKLTGLDVANWMARHLQDRPSVIIHSWNPDGTSMMHDVLVGAGFVVSCELFNGMCGPGDEDYSGPDNSMNGWVD